MYVSWELGYDTLVFFLTFARTAYVCWRHQRVKGATSRKPGLINNLVLDGAFYFG